MPLTTGPIDLRADEIDAMIGARNDGPSFLTGTFAGFAGACGDLAAAAGSLVAVGGAGSAAAGGGTAAAAGGVVARGGLVGAGVRRTGAMIVASPGTAGVMRTAVFSLTGGDTGAGSALRASGASAGGGVAGGGVAGGGATGGGVNARAS